VNLIRKAGELGQPLQVIFGGFHISKPPLGRYGIEAGDRIYAVSVRKGAFHLIASMTVDELVDVDTYMSRLDLEAEQRGGHRSLWDHAGEVALGRDGTPFDLRRVIPPEHVATITFQPKRGAARPISHVDGMIEQTTGLTGHYLRLSPETETLFRRVLAGPSASPPAPRTAPAPKRPVPAPAPPQESVALPAAGAGRRFHYVAGTSSKFWQISRTGKVVFVTFGRIGTRGQTQIKDLETDAAAEAHVNKLIGEKTRKGYAEVSAT
jgi:predicted DNA-binding WGR domain protein